VNGQIYAQPLVVSGIEIPGRGLHDVVYVATMENDVYAFDATNADEDHFLWKTKLGKPVPHTHVPWPLVAAVTGYNIKPAIGITSTPVIDAPSKRMWVAAKTFDDAGNSHYHLSCLDITNGKILATSDEIRANERHAKLRAETALQRTGLLRANGMIYLAFGAHQDAGDYAGWVVAFDATTLAQRSAFCVNTNDESGKGGIWQSGNGPAADAQGNIYVMTGNGDFNQKNHQFGMSFLKLSPDLKTVDWFTPWNFQKLSDQDVDLGSSGPMVLPGSEQVVGGGKEGWLYLLDHNQLGHLQPKHSTAPALQQFKAADHWSLTWISWLFSVFGYHHIHGSPVYWASAQLGPVVYIWPEQTRLKAFRYDPVTHFQKRPVAKGRRAPNGMPGGFLSISANGDRDGVVWACSPLLKDALIDTVPGVLRAFDAVTLKQLWSSDKKDPEDHFNFAKNCPPTVANGKVYLSTFSNKLNVYGLVKPPPPPKEEKGSLKGKPKLIKPGKTP